MNLKIYCKLNPNRPRLQASHFVWQKLLSQQEKLPTLPSGVILCLAYQIIKTTETGAAVTYVACDGVWARNQSGVRA